TATPNPNDTSPSAPKSDDPITSPTRLDEALGRDEHWNEYSVRYPGYLARRYREEVTVEGPRSFFSPSWSDEELRALFELPPSGRDDAYCHHLWESISWDRYLSGLTEERILAGNDMYSCLAKGFLPQGRAKA